MSDPPTHEIPSARSAREAQIERLTKERDEYKKRMEGAHAKIRAMMEDRDRGKFPTAWRRFEC